MTLKVVEFPKQKMRSAADMLRCIADDIEQGKHGDPNSQYGVLVLAKPNEAWPHTFGLGPDAIPPNVVWLLELAKAFMVTMHTERS